MFQQAPHLRNGLESLDELYEVLTLFKERDLAGNGKTIPFSSPVPAYIINSIMGSFGVNGGLGWGMDGMYLVDGKVKFGPIEPEYKEGLVFLNKLYNDGLIAQDYLAHNVTIYGSNIPENIGLTFGWTGSGVRTPLMAAGFSSDEATNMFRPISGMKGKDGKYHWFMSQVGMVTQPHGEFITVSNKYPVETMKWLDYKNSLEGAWTISVGPKGVSWDLDASGAPYVTDYIRNNPDGLDRDEAFLRNGGMIWLYTVTTGVSPVVPTSRWPYRYEDIDLNRDIYGPFKESLYSQHWRNWLDFEASRQLPPNLLFTSEEREEITLILQDLKTSVEENVHRFVMGLEPMNKWDEVVNTMKGMKVDRLIEIYQNALNK